VRVLGISGSLRRGSHNTRLLRAAAELLPAGVELEIYDGLRDLPLYDADIDGDPPPEAVARLRAAIAEADAVLVATPEYNASVPGVLKNAIDWASRPFRTNVLRGKPVAVMGASTGIFGAVWAQAEVRKILAHMGAAVIDRELAGGLAHELFDADGRVADEGLARELGELVAELSDAARASLGAAA
jgi:chromate reductase, NAD(P)H dehydrogenase (quinone)